MASCLWEPFPTCTPLCVSDTSLLLALVLLGATASLISGLSPQKTEPAKKQWVLYQFSFLHWIIYGLMHIPGKALAESMTGRQKGEWDFFQLKVWLNWIMNLQLEFPQDTDFDGEALLRSACPRSMPSWLLLPLCWSSQAPPMGPRNHPL